jgi:hypothetical protein
MPLGLPEAPPLNLSNPSIGEASAFANAGGHAYAAGMQFAQALREAAWQYQKQQQQQAFQQKVQLANQQTKLAQGGWQMGTPAQTTAPGSGSTPMNSLGQTGLQVRRGATSADPTDQSGNRIATAPGGPSLEGGTQVGDLNEALKSAGQPGFTTPAASDGNGSPAALLRFTDMQGNEWTKAAEKALDDTNSIVVTSRLAKSLADEYGLDLKPGQRVSYENLDKLGQATGHFGPKKPTQHYDPTSYNTPAIVNEDTGEAKPVTMQPGLAVNAEKGAWDEIKGGRGPNGELVLRNSKTNETKLVPLPEGATIGLTPEEQEIKNRHAETMAAVNQRHADNVARLNQNHADAQDEKQRKAVESAQRQITVYQGQEQKQHGLRSLYGGILATPDGKQFTDPKDGKNRTMNSNLRKFYQQKFDDATGQVKVLQDAQQKIMKRYGGDNSNAAAPAQNAPAAPAKAQQQQSPAQAPPVQGAGTKPAQPQSSGQIRVTAPDGSKHLFPNQAAADKFKKLAGIE